MKNINGENVTNNGKTFIFKIIYIQIGYNGGTSSHNYQALPNNEKEYKNNIMDP